MNRITLVFLLVLLFCSIVPRMAWAQERMDDPRLKELLRQRVSDGHTIGIVVGIIDEQGTRVVSEGTFSRTNKKAVDGDTIFEIGSVTKVFTTELLAEMVARGEVKLDDPVAKFLPAKVKVPRRDGREITLLDLATQHSGLPRLPGNFAPADGGNPYADYSVEQLYDFLSGHELRGDIGAKYDYSNLGMGLLGHALALKGGKSYETLIKERLCEPLGMQHTGITLSSADRRMLATGHNSRGRAVGNWDIPTLAGAGALRSSANDMLKFVAANLKLNASKLKPAMEMALEPRRELQPGMKIGLGWHIYLRYGGEIAWHNGGTGGYRSFIGLDRKGQRGVVVLSNSENDIDDIGLHLLEPKYALAKVKPVKQRQAASVSDAVLSGYAGRYQLNEQIFFNVRKAGDHLQVQLTGQSYLDVYPESETKFNYDAVEAAISFQRDSGGTASLVLHQNGLNQKAKKISDEAPKEPGTLKMDPKRFDALAGRYQLTPGAVFTVRREGNRLMVQLSGQPFFEVFPQSETKFFYKVVDAQLTFVADARGEVTELILHQNGVDQRAKRMK